MLAQLCADAGQPDLLLDLISGLGDVESASPSSGLWDLSRTVNASGELRALFDQGAAAVAAALPAATGGDLGRSARRSTGSWPSTACAGPNEWDIRARSWDADPVQALAHVDTLRHSTDDGSPTARAARLTARRQAAAQELAQALGGDEAKLATLELALRSAKDTIPLREQTKANAVVVVNEVRLAVRELGRRGVEAGRLAEPEDVMMLLADELDAYVADPAAHSPVIAERLVDYRSLFELEPPFIIADEVPPLDAVEATAARPREPPPSRGRS